MATEAASGSLVKIGSDTMGEVRSYSLEQQIETIEDTAMGDTARTYKVGLKSFTGSLDVNFDESDTAQAAVQTAIEDGTTVTFEIYPEGETTGDQYFTGTAIITGSTVTASFDGLVEGTISVQGTGALTQSTKA